jgi:hypothetical protein
MNIKKVAIKSKVGMEKVCTLPFRPEAKRTK